MENKKRLTLKDIAAKAGVSLTAASMFLNGKAKKYNLADATCDRIEQTMRENNFVPNFHARAIASKHARSARSACPSSRIAQSHGCRRLPRIGELQLRR